MEQFSKNIVIRNAAGILYVEIEREIGLRDVMHGCGEDKLPPFARPRLEFHKRKDGDMLVTLFDQANVFPSAIYLFFIGDDSIKSYIGRVDGEEQEDNVFSTWPV